MKINKNIFYLVGKYIEFNFEKVILNIHSLIFIESEINSRIIQNSTISYGKP